MRYNPAERRNNEIENWFNDFMPFTGNTLMRTDVREKDGKYLLDIDLPGFKKDDIRISLFNGSLTVSADHHESDEEKDARGRIVRKERYLGSCSRSWYVGEGIKETDIHASFDNGTLTLELPTEQKKAEEETQYISID